MVSTIRSLLGFPFSKKAAQLLPLSLVGLQKRPTGQVITPFVDSSGFFVSCQLLDVSSHTLDVPFGYSNHSSNIMYTLVDKDKEVRSIIFLVLGVFIASLTHNPLRMTIFSWH